MKVHKKPPEWNSFVFAEKLKWYAKNDNKMKNVFADKYKIKLILDELGLEGLKYAKIIEYVRPIYHTLGDYKVLIPVDHLLKDEKYHISEWRMDKMKSQTSSEEEFWELAHKKYGIIQEFQGNEEQGNEDEDEERNKSQKISKPIPKFYVVKLNLGWNTMIFFKNNKILKIVCGEREFKCEPENIVKWRNLTLKRYKKDIPAKFFMEEFIGFNLKVYEVYCIYGKPRILSVFYETDVPYESNYLIVDEQIKKGEDEYETIFNLSLIEDAHLIPDAEPFNVKLDDNVCQKICNYSKEFAKYFEFMRVDFYYTKGDIYFSECTFKPGALKRIKWQDIGRILSKYWTKKPEE